MAVPDKAPTQLEATPHTQKGSPETRQCGPDPAGAPSSQGQQQQHGQLRQQGPHPEFTDQPEGPHAMSSLGPPFWAPHTLLVGRRYALAIIEVMLLSLYVGVNNGRRAAGCISTAGPMSPLSPIPLPLPESAQHHPRYTSFPCNAPLWRQVAHVAPAALNPVATLTTDRGLAGFQLATFLPPLLLLVWPQLHHSPTFLWTYSLAVRLCTISGHAIQSVLCWRRGKGEVSTELVVMLYGVPKIGPGCVALWTPLLYWVPVRYQLWAGPLQLVLCLVAEVFTDYGAWGHLRLSAYQALMCMVCMVCMPLCMSGLHDSKMRVALQNRQRNSPPPLRPPPPELPPPVLLPPPPARPQQRAAQLPPATPPPQSPPPPPQQQQRPPPCVSTSPASVQGLAASSSGTRGSTSDPKPALPATATTCCCGEYRGQCVCDKQAGCGLCGPGPPAVSLDTIVAEVQQSGRGRGTALYRSRNKVVTAAVKVQDHPGTYTSYTSLLKPAVADHILASLNAVGSPYEPRVSVVCLPGCALAVAWVTVVGVVQPAMGDQGAAAQHDSNVYVPHSSTAQHRSSNVSRINAQKGLLGGEQVDEGSGVVRAEGDWVMVMGGVEEVLPYRDKLGRGVVVQESGRVWRCRYLSNDAGNVTAVQQPQQQLPRHHNHQHQHQRNRQQHHHHQHQQMSGQGGKPEDNSAPDQTGSNGHMVDAEGAGTMSRGALLSVTILTLRPPCLCINLTRHALPPPAASPRPPPTANRAADAERPPTHHSAPHALTHITASVQASAPTCVRVVLLLEDGEVVWEQEVGVREGVQDIPIPIHCLQGVVPPGAPATALRLMLLPAASTIHQHQHQQQEQTTGSSTPDPDAPPQLPPLYDSALLLVVPCSVAAELWRLWQRMVAELRGDSGNRWMAAGGGGGGEGVSGEAYWGEVQRWVPQQGISDDGGEGGGGGGAANEATNGRASLSHEVAAWQLHFQPLASDIALLVQAATPGPHPSPTWPIPAASSPSERTATCYLRSGMPQVVSDLVTYCHATNAPMLGAWVARMAQVHAELAHAQAQGQTQARIHESEGLREFLGEVQGSSGDGDSYSAPPTIGAGGGGKGQAEGEGVGQAEEVLFHALSGPADFAQGATGDGAQEMQCAPQRPQRGEGVHQRMPGGTDAAALVGALGKLRPGMPAELQQPTASQKTAQTTGMPDPLDKDSISPNSSRSSTHDSAQPGCKQHSSQILPLASPSCLLHSVLGFWQAELEKEYRGWAAQHIALWDHISVGFVGLFLLLGLALEGSSVGAMAVPTAVCFLWIIVLLGMHQFCQWSGAALGTVRGWALVACVCTEAVVMSATDSRSIGAAAARLVRSPLAMCTISAFRANQIKAAVLPLAAVDAVWRLGAHRLLCRVGVEEQCGGWVPHVFVAGWVVSVCVAVLTDARGRDQFLRAKQMWEGQQKKNV